MSKNNTQELSVFAQATQAIAAQASETDIKSFEELVGGGYLPRLQLCTSQAELCKSGAVPVNNYVIVVGRNSHKVLGQNVDIVPIMFRSTAMQTGDDLTITHDRESDLFGKLVALSGVQDSGAMYGPEFLVWIPSEKIFATLFCGSKTARNMAASIFENLTKMATMGSVKISGKKNVWYGMTCEASNAPCLNQPDLEELNKQIASFKDDKGTVEPQDAVESTGREV